MREVARAHGSGLLVTGDRDPAAAWLRVDLDGDPAAIELLRVETSGGWTAWIPTPDAVGLIVSGTGSPDSCASSGS